MTEEEKKLFLKYNSFYTTGYEKNADLNNKLYHNLLKYKDDYIFPRRWLILLHGSYACNANCIYCENHKLREYYGSAIITENIIKQIVYKLGPNIRGIIWHGGEPLLLPKSYFKLLFDLREKLKLNFSLSLQTNSILLTPEMDDFLNKYQYQIGSSFDGIFNTNNRGTDSTNAILNLYNRKTNNRPIGTISVITKDSIFNLIDNYEYLKAAGCNTTQTAIVRENVIEETNPYLIKNDIAVNEIIKYLKYWMYDTNNPIFDSFLNRRLTQVLGNSTVCEDGNCIGGWLVIDPLGNISTCGMNPIESNFGNILEINNYIDLLSNPKYLQCLSAQKKLLEQNCSDCEILNLCKGGCMGCNYEVDHNYTKLNERLCEYNKALINGIINVIADLDLTDPTIYNPFFIQILKDNNYYSLSEIYQIEKDFTHA